MKPKGPARLAVFSKGKKEEDARLLRFFEGEDQLERAAAKRTPPLKRGSPAILLDLSRLLRRARLGTLSGIDRVEQAYAEHLLHRAPDRLSLIAADPFGRPRLLPRAAAERFVGATGCAWRDGSASGLAAMARRLAASALLPRPLPDGPAVYLQVAHQHLHLRRRTEHLLKATGARLAAFVHDVIPIDFPEYASPGQAARHLERVRTVAALADAVIVNSAQTAADLAPHLAKARRAPPVVTAHLGVRPAALPAQAPSWPPFFLCLGTIEPRKNHAMLLQVWRRLMDRHGDAAPRLVIVGRRGWESEAVIDLLERSPACARLVTEHAAAGDAAVAGLLRSCRALLFPSFAEGFGLPVAEALAAGAPVLCSDLPVLREVGGAAPDYLDPLDGAGWLAAIEDYAAEPSLRRNAQCARIAVWRAPTWEAHFDIVMPLLDQLGEVRPRAR